MSIQARRQRLPGAQGFAERLVDDQWANFQNFNFGAAAALPQQQQQHRPQGLGVIQIPLILSHDKDVLLATLLMTMNAMQSIVFTIRS